MANFVDLGELLFCGDLAFFYTEAGAEDNLGFVSWMAGLEAAFTVIVIEIFNWLDGDLGGFGIEEHGVDKNILSFEAIAARVAADGSPNCAGQTDPFFEASEAFV